MTEVSFSSGEAFFARLKFEVLLRLRNRGDLIQPIVFFLMVLSLFPIAVNLAQAELAKLAPGIFWVIVLLSSLFSSELLFKEDYRDGSLAQAVIGPQPLMAYALAKILVHWMAVALPLLLATPLMALMIAVPVQGLLSLMVSLSLGSCSLCFLAAIGAALTVSLGQRSLLMAVIILPFYIPVLIFGSAAVQFAIDGLDIGNQLLVLLALALLSVSLSPSVVASALRISVERS